MGYLPFVHLPAPWIYYIDSKQSGGMLKPSPDSALGAHCPSSRTDSLITSTQARQTFFGDNDRPEIPNSLAGSLTQLRRALPCKRSSCFCQAHF